MSEDKIIVCEDCGQEFPWTKDEPRRTWLLFIHGVEGK
jgi:hypothetical protein